MPDKCRGPALELPLGPLWLEAKQGYTDTAVWGGLSSFMQRWAEETAAQASAAATKQALFNIANLFVDYDATTVERRREIVHRAEKAIRALKRATPSCRRRELSIKPVSLTAPVSALYGVGVRRADLLRRIGIQAVGDLLRYAPTRYEDRRTISSLQSLTHPGRVVVSVEVTGPGRTSQRGKMTISEVPVRDATGEALLVWFNQAYRAQQFPVGTQLLCSGTVRTVLGRTSLCSPECEVVGNAPALHMERIVPIYPLTKGLTQPLLRSLVAQALQRTNHLQEDILPPDLLKRRGLLPAKDARHALHFPNTMRQGVEARRRFAYEEMFILQLLLALRRRVMHDTAKGIALEIDAGLDAEFAAALPFVLTDAQRRVLRTVSQDLASDRPAMRLIHGDVGSGKTIIAAFALLAGARAGRQAAFMAPTELLAQQHCRVLAEMLRPYGIQPVLLTGNVLTRDKRRIRASLAAGDIRVIVGTHALIQQGTQFANLAVVAVDEQHRFGVLQRAALAGKGPRPHLFVMTATPIPRTLALVLYGDCDVSVLDELPSNRQPILTKVLRQQDWPRACQAVRDAVAAGQQAFIVLPLIEESESLQANAARQRYEELTAGELRGLRVGLLHGKLKPDLSAKVMQAFREGELDVLVTTTVIEVGVDVPNATVMVIENAERFGLAQLHQLRGRIGRGTQQGMCYLISSVGRDNPAWKRLALLEHTTDGFEVAEADLRWRGPGELIGTRQAGFPELCVTDLRADTSIIELAREDAFALVTADPQLARPEYAALRSILERKMQKLMPLLRGD
ncbi:MAG: ATP-dependent DNA helicase RecG [Candidatus Zipacnadales bacterium]